MRKSILMLSSMTLAILMMTGVSFAAPSSLDPSFDGDGKVHTDFAPSDDPRDEEARNVALQSDGKIVAVGYAQADQFGDNGGFALARYNTDGTLDASFDSDGKATTNVGGGKGLRRW